MSLTSLGAPATAGVVGSPYAITPSAATGGSFDIANYTPTYVAGALTVTAAPLTITADDGTKVYGDVFGLVGTAFTSSGLKNGETIGPVSLTSLGAPATAGVVGSPYAITPSAATGGGFDIANYTPTYVDGALTVLPRPLLITADNGTKLYGDVFGFTGTEFISSGLQNGETIGSVSLTSLGRRQRRTWPAVLTPSPPVRRLAAHPTSPITLSPMSTAS